MAEFKNRYIVLFGLLFIFVFYQVISDQSLLQRSIYCGEIGNSSFKAKRPIPFVESSSQRTTIINSLCSNQATLTGPGQKVVSFTLFIKNKKAAKFVIHRYATNLRANLNRIRELYPGWLMRLYTDIYDESGIFKSMLKQSDFFLCNITKIPGLGNISASDGRVWRFLPIGDRTVNTFVSRDADSLINSRERSAVRQWEGSNKTFHAMRDNPKHTALILAGMWGAKNYLLSNTMRQALLSIFVEVPILKGKNEQGLLAQTVYSFYKSDFMIHDSYNCKLHKDSIPFPEKRTDLINFVGSYAGVWHPSTKIVAKCPKACRPKCGQDWIYC